MEMTLTKITAVCLGLSLAAGAAWAECTSTSRWGADDTLGSANLVTPERTLMASQLIKQGKSMPLGIAIGLPAPLAQSASGSAEPAGRAKALGFRV